MIEQYTHDVIKWAGVAAVEAAKAHAIAEFPKESCGFIAGGEYVACENKHEDPLAYFKIDDARYDLAVAEGRLQAVVHSHPDGPIFPSHADMAQQIACDVPFIIVSLNETGIHKLVAWGNQLPIAPIIGRPFVHGIFDCYAAVRDVYRLGRDRLREQGAYWPLEPIYLPEVPRDDNWWQSGQDLYADHLEIVGFKQITRSEARPGDAFLIKIGGRQGNPHDRLNHAGVLMEHDQIYHHTPMRISSRVPAGLWANAADMWVRYTGNAQ